MDETSNTIIGQLQHIADVSEKGFNKLVAAYGGGWKIDEVKSDPREEVLIRYTVGTGEFSDDMKFNVLRMKMFMMNGEPDGTHDGVWEPMVEPQEFFKRPKPLKGPLDKPEGPIEHIPIRAFTKAIWTFGDNSSITAVGPANLHLVKLDDESQIFLVCVAAIITNGTGKYDGAYGVKTAIGSTHVPKGWSCSIFRRASSLGQRRSRPSESFARAMLQWGSDRSNETREEISHA